MYRPFLAEQRPGTILYLAIRRQTFETRFKERVGEVTRTVYGIKLIVFDPDTRRIIEWIE